MNTLNPAKSTATILSVDDVNVTSVLSHRSKKIIVDHPIDNDEAVILALGYQQEFKRELSMLTTFGVAFSVLGLLPSIASTLWYSLAYVGNAGLTWGYLLCMVGVISVAMSMAEIASAFPTSGGLYYATAMMAPPKYKAILSWTVGWSNYFVQVTGAPSVAWGCASMILALKTLIDPDYSPTNGQMYLLTMGLTFVSSIIASAPTKWLSWINGISSILNGVFMFISFVIILGGNNRVEQGLSRFNHDSMAWSVDNLTEWPDGIAVLLSFMSGLWIMSGYDSPFHLCEECSNAQTATPKAIVLCAYSGAILGFAFQLAMAYTIVDVDAAVNDELGQPYVAFLKQIMSNEKVFALTAFAVILSFNMTFACMIAASRVLFSYSRDGCFPLSRYWSSVNPVTKTPVNAVWANWFIGQLLLLLLFGGEAPMDAIFSVGAIGAFVSFTIPIVLRITYARKTFIRGPWNLGRFSDLFGCVAAAFVLLMIPILNFPQYRGADNTPDVMNWTVVVYWGSLFLAIGWYYLYAHKIYQGPKSNIDGRNLLSVEEAELITEGIKINDEKVVIYDSSEEKV
ncbi:hypothetical protein CANARDRAFT_28446 [[Candida] arabinofermentans NRRL YB-2248]|uniref:Amino acid permease/ SLC12A domain-containing protein n=1 Tax=[Candida] arabinofermentans NRRL YB-2248 TaxID=983967 RepID=A0A1E4T086_9ASCO|nr:hypothetical protein CANARDRAFT_28446 [[Candida] arabinofermentans NRRL YB-2248]